MLMKRKNKRWRWGIYRVLSLGAAIFLAGCSNAANSTPCPKTDCPKCPQIITTELPEPNCPECPPFEVQASTSLPLPEALLSKYRELWENSAHGQSNTVPCEICHTETDNVSNDLILVTGVQISGSGSKTKCLVCHQGQNARTAINDAIEAAAVAGEDTVDENLAFVEMPQSAPVGAQLGAWGGGGYRYADKSYDARFAHVEGYDTCCDCHDSHSLSLKLDGCSKCHQGVDAPDDFGRIRGDFSVADYDGDRNTLEGIQLEIEGLQAILYQAIQVHAANFGKPIVYDPDKAPYFYNDGEGNGQLDEGEALETNRYNAWSGRLLKAAYNYNFSKKDSGAFIHGGKYIIQLLYDSIETLDPTLTEDLERDDPAHFNGAAGAWRIYDAVGQVDGECARCHSAAGLPTYLTVGDNYYPERLSNGLACSTCHSDLRRYKRFVVESVTFPGGDKYSLDADSNLCISCHQGRAAAADLEKLLLGLAPDETAVGLYIPDIHGYQAGLTILGSQGGGAYLYAGKRYAGRNLHVEEFDDCVDCHGGHALAIDEEQCGTCHGHRASDERTKPQHHPSPMGCRDCHGMVNVEEIRGHKDYLPLIDFDGDGDRQEGLSQEVRTMETALFGAIQAHANEQVGTPLVFDAYNSPNFFVDINANGQLDPGEASQDNRYTTWTPRLMQAAYNYLYAIKDPGAYAHNGKYILQVLYDSLADLGGETSGLVRP